MCIFAHEAWTTLETTNEGTNIVKQSKLQRLTIIFETLKVYESETIGEFYAKLCNLSN